MRRGEALEAKPSPESPFSKLSGALTRVVAEQGRTKRDSRWLGEWRAQGIFDYPQPLMGSFLFRNSQADLKYVSILKRIVFVLP